MKDKIKYFFITVLLVLVANYFLVKKYSKVDITKLVGIYTYSGENYIDTLILFENYSSYHSIVDNRNNKYQRKYGKWGCPVIGTLVIQNYSFDEANYPVDVKCDYDFFWRVRISVGLSDKYKKINYP